MQLKAIFLAILESAVACNLTLLSCPNPSLIQSSSMAAERIPQHRMLVKQSSWQLDRWEQKGAAILLAPKTKIELRFKDNQVNGFGGCNRFSGSFKLVGNQLSFGTLEATQRGCNRLLTTQETRFLAALQAVHHVTSDNSGHLILSYTLSANQGILYFVPEKQLK